MNAVATWSPADTRLGEDEITEVRAVVDEIRSEHPIGLAVLSGSLVMGLGHELSDLDLYIATSDGSAVPRIGRRVLGRSAQVNPVSEQRINEILEYGECLKVSSSDRSQLAFHPSDYKLLLRLVNGIVLHADSKFSRLLSRIDANAVRQLTLVNHSVKCVELAEDVQGTLESGDVLTAMSASSNLLCHGMAAGLAGVGEIYDHEKVTLRRLARHQGTAHLIDPAWDLLSRGVPFGCALSDAVQICQARSLLASHLSGYANVYGWASPAARVPDFLMRQNGPRRKSDFGLIRFTDGIALTGRDHGFKVTELMARLWLALDGSPIEHVMRSPLLEDASATEDTIRTAVSRLVAAGAVEAG